MEDDPQLVDLALCEAAETGDLPTLRQLLSAAPELATAVDHLIGWTPLMHAVMRCQEGAVGLLLEVAPEAALMQDGSGHAPLMSASFAGGTLSPPAKEDL